MAGSPAWKLYTADNRYVASTHDLAIFAASIGVLGDGATIRHGHSRKDIVWTEGAEECLAFESYDTVCITCEDRVLTRQTKARFGYGG